MKILASLGKILPTAHQREVERRMALMAAKRKVDELDRYCDERDRRVAAKHAQAVEFKRQKNELRGKEALREKNDEQRLLELGLKIRRLAQKCYSRLELNRIGADVVLSMIPMLEEAQEASDPQRIHEAMARLDDLDRQLDGYHAVDSSDTVETTAGLDVEWDRLDAGSAVGDPEPAPAAPVSGRPVERPMKPAEPDARHAALLERLQAARARMES